MWGICENDVKSLCKQSTDLIGFYFIFSSSRVRDYSCILFDDDSDATNWARSMNQTCYSECVQIQILCCFLLKIKFMEIKVDCIEWSNLAAHSSQLDDNDFYYMFV